MAQEQITAREQAIDIATQHMKKAAMEMLVYYKDILEPQDIMSFTTMALVEIIEMFAKTYDLDTKEIAQTTCEAIKGVLEI